jgi:hypothetical protein
MLESNLGYNNLAYWQNFSIIPPKNNSRNQIKPAGYTINWELNYIDLSPEEAKQLSRVEYFG